MSNIADNTALAPARAQGFQKMRVTAIKSLSVVAALWIFALMLLICADVVGLKLFSQPIYGVIEVTEYSIVPIVFLQLSYALHTGRLTRADFLHSPFKARHPFSAALLEVAFMVAGIVIFAFLGQMLFGEVVSAYQDRDYFGSAGIFTFPIWPFYLVTLIGCAVLVAEFCLLTLEAMVSFVGHRHDVTRREVIWTLIATAVLAGFVTWIGASELERLTLGFLIIGFLIFLLLAGMPVAIVLSLVGIVGIWFIRENPTIALKSFKTAAMGSINKFDFGVVPLFVLMGLFTDIAGIGRDAYRVAAWWTRRLFGGLGIATVVANTMFAAVTGISIASAAIFSRVAVPQMTSHGYTARFAAGTVAGSSVLGMLIPPSLLLIIYGFVTESSVGKLFLAAIVPGAILAALFCLAIILMAKLRPAFVGDIEAADDLEPETLLSSAKLIAPISVLVGVVLGGIYLGWFTATQAGAIGALAAMILAVVRRRLTWEKLLSTLLETGQISVSVLTLIIGASVLTKALVMSTLPNQMIDLATGAGMGFWGVMIVYLLVVVLMGMFLDSTSIIVITVPLVLPLVSALGADVIGPHIVIWFGIVSIVTVELGLLTPPFGITVFVVKATIGKVCSLADVFLGAFPYVLAMLILVILMLLIPSLVTGIL